MKKLNNDVQESTFLPLSLRKG